MLDRTSFYAERGGQIGDRGTISTATKLHSKCATRSIWVKPSRIPASCSRGEHSAGRNRCIPASIRAGGARSGAITPRRTCLQRALKDVLGEEVKQAGSWVGIDRMRFDFRWPRGALTPEQKREIAHRVNEMIRDDSHLVTRVLPLEEAKQTGAIWMAGEKYGELIRVVQAGPSVEFCGGTHSHSTGELGMFVILSEFSIGSGIRRIESCVSDAAEEYRRQAERADRQTFLRRWRLRPTSCATASTSCSARSKICRRRWGSSRPSLPPSKRQSYVERAERSGDRTFVGAVVPEAGGEALRHLGSRDPQPVAERRHRTRRSRRRQRQPPGQRQRRFGQGRRACRQPGQTCGAAGIAAKAAASRASARRRQKRRRRRGGRARDSRRRLGMIARAAGGVLAIVVLARCAPGGARFAVRAQALCGGRRRR